MNKNSRKGGAQWNALFLVSQPQASAGSPLEAGRQESQGLPEELGKGEVSKDVTKCPDTTWSNLEKVTYTVVRGC